MSARSSRSARLLYHLRVRPGSLPPFVLLPGDPARARAIASTWERSRTVAEHREFVTLEGTVHGVPVAVVSTGIGGPAMAIAVEEVAVAGGRTLIRVGSSGPIAPGLRGGEVAISSAAARFEGTSAAYVPAGYPAVPDASVFAALVDSAQDLRVPFRTGITATVDTFHPSQGRAGHRPLARPSGVPTLAELRSWGILNIEMEGSVLLTLARLYGLKAGVVCAVYPETPSGDPDPQGQDRAIAVANGAVARLGRGSIPPGRPPTARSEGAGPGPRYPRGRLT